VNTHNTIDNIQNFSVTITVNKRLDGYGTYQEEYCYDENISMINSFTNPYAKTIKKGKKYVK